MSPNLKQCETQALKLTPKERGILAERLISSLDVIDETECERLWVEEADRRFKGYKKGAIAARPASTVLRGARARINENSSVSSAGRIGNAGRSIVLSIAGSGSGVGLFRENRYGFTGRCRKS